MANTKAEIVDAAIAAGVGPVEGMTKAEIIDAMGGG